MKSDKSYELQQDPNYTPNLDDCKASNLLHANYIVI